MMQGEALRDQIRLHAILHGAYDHLVREPEAAIGNADVAAKQTASNEP